MKADAYLRSYILEEKDKIQFPGNMCSCIATLTVLCVSCVANYYREHMYRQCVNRSCFFSEIQGSTWNTGYPTITKRHSPLDHQF